MNSLEISSDIPELFKALLEQPFSFSSFNENENEKDKLSGDEADCEGVSGLGPSASLTPAIWEKTIPYDGKTFHLEYMDLDEFLMENGISALAEEGQQKSPETETSLSSSVTLLPAAELEHCNEEVVTTVVKSSDSTEDETGIKTPDPVNPEDIEIEVNFEPDPADLILSSIPGGELFDPRKHRFAEEDLKPQPIIKKAKKIFVPEDLKDEKYWQRRKNNNMAAKRSREARRVKENQIAVRAAFLERENTALRLEVAELRKDLGRCKNSVSRYEAKYGAL